MNVARAMVAGSSNHVLILEDYAKLLLDYEFDRLHPIDSPLF